MPVAAGVHDVLSQTEQHTRCLCRRRGGRSIRGFRAAAAAPMVYYSLVSAMAANVLATSASMPRFRQRLRRMVRPTTVTRSRGPPCADVQQLATPLRAGLEHRVDELGASLERRLAPPPARL